MFVNPVTMLVVLSHFDKIQALSKSKKQNAEIIKKLTGIENYDAKDDQIKGLISKISYKNYSKIIIELTKTRMHYVTELFINYEQQYKPYFHVFFDDKKEEENYPTNLNLGIIDSFKHLIRANITNKQKEIIKGYCYGKQKIKKNKNNN